MTPSAYVPLTLLDLSLAAVLLLISGALSLALRLGFERDVTVSTLRMIVQLAIVAIALKFIFEVNSIGWTLLFAAIMFGAAVYETVSRQTAKFPGWQTELISAVPQFAIGLVATLVATGAVIGGDPWFAPRYVLPILGMVLGNTMSGVSLVMGSLIDGATRERAAIEAQLALGSTRYEAFSDVLRRAIKTGVTPILSSMAATGIVALPGMMTGQVLAGVNPVDAGKYQIMILMLIAGSVALCVVAAAYATVWFLSDDRERLRLDRLQKSSSERR